MAKRNGIHSQVLGGSIRVVDSVETVSDVMKELDISGNYTMAINGQPAQLSDTLPASGRVLVTFAEMVKGNLSTCNY